MGFNPKRKGARSYYPLFCTVARTSRVLDFHHRPGNGHDAKGAREFILSSIAAVRQELPWATVEARLDSAFFGDEIVEELDRAGVRFAISVPFERFAGLKRTIGAHKKWQWLVETWSCFESGWKPKAWKRRYRFLFIREKAKVLAKQPVQPSGGRRPSALPYGNSSNSRRSGIG